MEQRLVKYTLMADTPTGQFRPRSIRSRLARVTELVEKKHQKVDMADQDRRRLYTWVAANVPYYGTYEHTRPGTPGSRDLWQGAAWFQRFSRVYARKCSRCHGDPTADGLPETYIDYEKPSLSYILKTPLAEKAGGLPTPSGMPEVFKTTQDPDYQEMLRAIESWGDELDARPRVDMEGAKPVPYPREFGRLFSAPDGG
jgi:hypothetical protein